MEGVAVARSVVVSTGAAPDSGLDVVEGSPEGAGAVGEVGSLELCVEGVPLDGAGAATRLVPPGVALGMIATGDGTTGVETVWGGLAAAEAPVDEAAVSGCPACAGAYALHR